MRSLDHTGNTQTLFRAIADSAAVLLWVSGTDSGCSYVNTGWLNFTGRALEEELGEGWSSAIHLDDRELAVAAYREAFARREPFRVEYRLRRADGEYRWVLDQGTPRFNADGTFAGYFGCAMDITDQKRAEETLREADRRKDDFLAILGHELRNPLAAIVGAAGVLESIGDQTVEAHEMRETIHRQAGHMARLLDDLLDISRITRGKIALRKEPLDLAMLVRQTVDDHRKYIESVCCTIGLELPDEPVRVLGDPTRLAQVVGNILHNAGKFTEKGGNIQVSVGVAQGEALVCIRDTGIGMDRQTREQVFEPFVQGEFSRGRRVGLGLGMALAKGLLELHGGRIEAESPGKGDGSTFSIVLPIETSTVQVPHVEIPVPAFDRPCRILMIDDTRAVAYPLSRLMQLAGHQVTMAADGETGLAVAREFKPDVVFCDIGLPGMDGYDVARALRSDDAISQAKLVAITGFGQESDRRKALEAGFDRHVTKPVAESELRKLLNELFGPERFTPAKGIDRVEPTPLAEFPVVKSS